MKHNKSSQHLTDSLINQLPEHIQDLYWEAFYRAINASKSSPTKKNGDSSKEEAAHMFAWLEVKKKYEEKSDGGWEE